MVTALVLHLVTTQAGLSADGFSARLLAQAPASGTQELPLDAQIEALNRRILDINVNFPKPASAAIAIGALVAYVDLLVFVSSLSFATPATLVVLISVGVGALALVLIGAIVGGVVSAQNREEREALIEERESLKRQLGPSDFPPPMVDRSAPSPTLLVATF